jgi:hypothetical protein
MSLLRLCFRGPTGSKLPSWIAWFSILLAASAAPAGNKLFVGSLSWDTDDGGTRMKVRPLQDRVLVYRPDGAGGSTGAEAYVETTRGTGTLMSLPNPFGSSDSGANDVDCEESSGVCIASGSVENTSGDPQPILWACTASACTSWTTTLLPLPSGHTSGVARGVFIPQPSGLVDAVAVGWTSDSSGIAKAVAWRPGAVGGWDVTLLPELDPLPTPPKESIAFGYQKISSAHAVVAGRAVNDSGDSKPVAWYFDTALSSWGSPVSLPLPVGSSEGAAAALTVTGGTPGSQLMTIAAVAEIDDGGTPGTQALRLQCTTGTSPSSDCGAAGSWNLKSLAPLPGHGSSSALDVAVLPNGYATLAGTSYPSSTDPYDTGEATLWIVDSSSHTIVATLRVSDLAYDLAAGDVPRVLASFRASPGDGLGVHAVSGTKLGGGPRRWLMTEVPWNRRVSEIVLVPTGGGRFDVQVGWRIDLGGSVAGDTELGAAVGLEINGVPEASAEAEPCLIWELDAGGEYDCESLPDGASCGSATLNDAPITLTCDAGAGTCGVDFTTVFSDLSLHTNDSVLATLTPLPATEAETVLDDDFLEVLVGLVVEVPALGAGGLTGLALLLMASSWLVIRNRAHVKRRANRV